MKTRTRPLKHFSLSMQAIERLHEIADRQSRSESAVVDQLIQEAKMPPPRKTS